MRHRVLVVDDHPDAAAMASKLFELLGHESRKLTASASALAFAETFQPDVALLDIGMPDVSGFELARQLRTRFGSKLCLVAWTGWGKPEDRERAVVAGFDHFLLKPVDARELAALMQEIDLRLTAID